MADSPDEHRRQLEALDRQFRKAFWILAGFVSTVLIMAFIGLIFAIHYTI